MGKTDTVTKNYMRRPDVFADVFNQFLYHGIILAYKEMGRSQEEAKTYITMKCEKNEEEADALIKKYWK